MNEAIKQLLFSKNEKIINMVVKRAGRDFPDDIAIIGLTGSFRTGDFHEKSDLDLIIINNTPRGWQISDCFILDDVGYDIYCTPWETRIKDQSTLESSHISCLLEMQILYCAKPEYMDRLNELKQNALDILAKPIGKECLDRAKKSIDLAKQNYAETLLRCDIGVVRFAACGVVYNLVNALVSINNTYIKRGVKRYREELKALKHLPENFDDEYMSVIKASTVDEIRIKSKSILKSVIRLYDDMCENFIEKPEPTKENAKGTYEELWCNCKNKVIASCDSGDISYAYHAAMGAQDYLDEMTRMIGSKKFDLMQHFDAENLHTFKEAFLQVMDEYLDIYKAIDLQPKIYETFEEVYEQYMAV